VSKRSRGRGSSPARGKFDVAGSLREILDQRGIQERDRRRLLAAVALSDPSGEIADEASVCAIVGNAIAAAEALGEEPVKFVLRCRRRVFRKGRSPTQRGPRAPAKSPRSNVHVRLGQEDAALVLRGDGTYEVFDPQADHDEQEASEACWAVSCLAHFATEPTLMRELSSRFERYLYDHLDEIQDKH